MYQLKLKKNRSIVSVIDAGMFGTLFINTPKVDLKNAFFFFFLLSCTFFLHYGYPIYSYIKRIYTFF